MLYRPNSDYTEYSSMLRACCPLYKTSPVVGMQRPSVHMRLAIRTSRQTSRDAVEVPAGRCQVEGWPSY